MKRPKLFKRLAIVVSCAAYIKSERFGDNVPLSFFVQWSNTSRIKNPLYKRRISVVIVYVWKYRLNPHSKSPPGKNTFFVHAGSLKFAAIKNSNFIIPHLQAKFTNELEKFTFYFFGLQSKVYRTVEPLLYSWKFSVHCVFPNTRKVLWICQTLFWTHPIHYIYPMLVPFSHMV